MSKKKSSSRLFDAAERARQLGTSISNKKDPQVDGWENVVTGLGQSRDKRTGGGVGVTIPFREFQVEELYTADNIARRLVDLMPSETYREGYEFTKLDKDVMDETVTSLSMLQANQRMENAEWWARLYGGAGVFVSVDDGLDMSEPLDLNRVRRVNGLVPLTRWELWAQYRDLVRNINDPNFGYPKRYFLQPRRGLPFTQSQVKMNVGGITPTPPTQKGDKDDKKQIEMNHPIHASRIIRFDGKRLPIRKRASNNYWEDSVYTAAFEALRDYQVSHGYGASIVHDFSLHVIAVKNLAAMLSAADGDDDIKKRFEVIAYLKNMLGLIPIDAEAEKFENISRSIAGLPELMDRITHRFQAYTDIPHTILFNESPSGLGATGNHEEKLWYNLVHAHQRNYSQPRWNRLLEILWRSKEGPTRGRIPKAWTMRWVPLWQPTDLEVSQTRMNNATADEKYFEMGVLDAETIAESRFAGEAYGMDITLPEGYKVSPPVQPDPVTEEPTAKPGEEPKPAKEQQTDSASDFLDLLDTSKRPVQTFIVSKQLAASEEAAKAIATKYGMKTENVDPTTESYRFRQREPGEFKPNSYKTFNPKKGIGIVYGTLKG